MAIQDRTAEFKAHVQASSRKIKRPPSERHLLEDEKRAVVKGGRGEFARRAAEIGRSINATMGKLERLANCECCLGVRKGGRGANGCSGEEENAL